MFAIRPMFADRRDAGRRLARALGGHAGEQPIVLALPRGGVPVAYEVASALDAVLDVLFVRKIGAPGHPEFGLGAVVDGNDPQMVLNEEAVRELQPSPSYLEEEKRRQLEEIEHRRRMYRPGDQPPPQVEGRTIILVDDGIATGGTVRAALKALRRAGVGRLILAVPVAPADTLEALRTEVDEVVCLVEPEPFYAVGLYYDNFGQTSDAEVIELLSRSRHAPAPGGAVDPPAAHR